MSLKDAAILVTNVARGSGAACAHALAARGANLMVSASDADDVARVEADLRQYGVAVTGVRTDIARGREVEALVGEAMRFFGAIDGVVVVPEITAGRPLLETDDETFDRGLAAGVRSAYVVCQRAARVMVAGGRGGSLILVGPPSALGGGPVTAIARDALAGLARELAAELRPQHIRVNAVLQGPEGERDAAVAAVASFLLDDDSGDMSGAVIDLGGGGAA